MTKPGFRTALLEVAVSIGGYYLLRAFGVAVFWALTGPAIVVGLVAVAATVRRRRIDLIGLLVLVELVTTSTLSLVTQSPRVAALREVAYVLVVGVFFLVTLLRAPVTHVSAASVATFGDPAREQAFEHAWRAVPKYRRWQRMLTAILGLLLVVSSFVRAGILFSARDSGIAHAVDVSNVVFLVMLGAAVVTSAVLIRVPRRIIEQLAAKT
ncbi:hypothetical protein GCM10022222_04390 [Amycolatopsis ultiminotia]|uniref:Intracellular septation protein A n=1 Tax=Amycolatopsis ultiminotia TaxID=543629 RepID=A0ABP6UXQ0_9PSEU